MKAKQLYGLISMMSFFGVCASAFAQDGPPPPNDPGGPPPMQGPGPDSGQMRRRMGPPMVPLFLRPDVQKELKLTDEQIEKVRQLLPPPPTGGPDGGRMRGPGGGDAGQPGGPPPPMHGPDGGWLRGPGEIDNRLAEILSDSQMKRLRELRLQRQGATALVRPEIADKVGLSDEERQRIRVMLDEDMRAQLDSQDGPPDQKTMEAKHTKLNADILRMLSSSEKSKWDQMCGKPFKFDENWHPKPMAGDHGRTRQGDPDEGAPPQLQAGG